MVQSMKTTLSAFLLLLLGPAFVGAQTPLSNDSSMGLWPWLVKNINADIPRIVADTKANDLDAIYVSVFRVLGNRQGDLPMEDESGRWLSSWGTKSNYMRLSSLISQAHAAGLQVVGVMSCFKSGALPTDKGHCDYLLDVIGYFFEHFRINGEPYYDLDGMCLDYIRFPSGYNRDPQHVNAFLDRIRQRFPWLPLHAYVIANAYSYDGPNYNNNFNSYSQVIQTISTGYGQNYEQMASRLEVMLPMAYVSDGGVYGQNKAYMKGYVKKVAEYCRRAATLGGAPNTRVIPAIKTYGTADSASVAASTEGAMEGGAHGVSSFRYYTGNAAMFKAMAAYNRPGPNRPVAAMTLAGKGQTLRFDSSGTRDGQDPPSKLTIRYDLDDDGSPDTSYLAVGSAELLARAPGTLVVGMEVLDSEGHRDRTRREIYLPDTMKTTFPLLSVANGGLVELPFELGPAGGGGVYIVLASLTGTSPGIPLAPGITLPLAYDTMTWVSAFLAGGAPFLRSLGTAPPGGSVKPAFSPGPGILPAALAGMDLHFATAIFAPVGLAPAGVTNPVKIYLVP